MERGIMSSKLPGDTEDLSGVQGIVAVEDDGRGHATLLTRNEHGLKENVIWHPYWAVADLPKDLKGWPLKKFFKAELQDGETYNFLSSYNSRNLREVLEHHRDTTPRDKDVPGWPAIYHVKSRVQQLMTLSGARMYQGIDLEDVSRLYISVVSTPTGTERGDPAKEAIIAVSLRSSGGMRRDITTCNGSEEELLRGVFDFIEDADPDIIIGHGLLRWDLPALVLRADRFGIDNRLGRDILHSDSLGDAYSMWVSAGAASCRSPMVHIVGRQVIDTELLLRRYDESGQKLLRSYSLIDAASALELSVSGALLSLDELQMAGQDTDRLEAHAREATRLIETVADRLLPPYFHLVRHVPFPLEQAALLGAERMTEAVLVGDHVRQWHGLPHPRSKDRIPGGASEIRLAGLVRNVIGVDISGLYAGLMVDNGIGPSTDRVDAFKSLVKEMTKKRRSLMNEAGKEKSPARRASLKAEADALKLLVNSAWGGLNRDGGLFTDPLAAATVAYLGHEVAYQMLAIIEAEGGQPVLLMTDGVYFAAPPSVKTVADARRLVTRIAKQMPKGIDLRFEGLWSAMFSHSRGNYALVDDNGEIAIKGSVLRSRSLEPFVARFMRDAIKALANEDLAGLRKLYLETRAAVTENRFTVQEFVRSAVLRRTLKEYEVAAGRRQARPEPHVELALRARDDSRLRRYGQGDRVEYYVRKEMKTSPRVGDTTEWDQDHPDHDTSELLKSLDKAARHLSIALSDEDATLVFNHSDRDVDLASVRVAEPKRAGPVLEYHEHLEHAEKIIDVMSRLSEANHAVAALKGKKPIEDGFLDSPPSPDDVRQRHKLWAYSARQAEAPLNFALLTGANHNLTVLDVDVLGGGTVDGFVHQYLSADDMIVRTGGGTNIHAYFHHEPNLRSSAVYLTHGSTKLRIEVKGDRLSATGPGSISPTTGGLYQVISLASAVDDPLEDLLANLTEMPAALIEAIQTAPRAGSSAPSGKRVTAAVAFSASISERTTELRSFITPIVEAGNVGPILAAARTHPPVSEARNRDLVSFCGQVLGLTHGADLGAVLEAYTRCFHDPPLPSDNVHSVADAATRWMSRKVSLNDDIVDLLRRKGPMAERWLAHHLRRDKNVIHKAVEDLIGQRQVFKRGKGRSSKVYPAPQGPSTRRMQSIYR